jgi:murein DD-endopeptidase MepM/ murein hydrolase activator NlpD
LFEGQVRGHEVLCEESKVHIIVVSDRMATAKTLTITPRVVAATAAALTTTIVMLAALFSYLTLRHAADLQLPFLQSALMALQQKEAQRTEEFVRDNVGAIAAKVGQMQAQLLHLDSLGERLSSLAGIKPDQPPPAKGGQGGPLVAPAQNLSAAELGQQVDKMLRAVEQKTDLLTAVESTLIEQRVIQNRLPTALPVDAAWNASAFGWRLDPFTGQRAMHEGVDFHADVGAPIVAAAAGVVTFAERHPEYGNLVEIDHGNDYSTRYAHASKLLVTAGQVVRRGQKVAEVGSTGRSTGPHLHFEVRYKGAAQNPSRFLEHATRIASR